MANTRETLGDQATLDGLVADTLTSFEEDGIRSVPALAFYMKKALTSVTLPSVTSIGGNAFQGCSALTTVDLSNTAQVSINSSAFNNLSSLTHLIIRSNTISTLVNSNALSGTAIARKEGAIYVPSSLVGTYEADTKWKNFIIASTDDYPLSSFYTIKDSWSQIKANVANGTYTSKYAIGDTTLININSVPWVVEIVAFDTDTKADGNGTAPITWCLKKVYTTRAMGTGDTTGGWEASGMRSYLESDIYPVVDIKDDIIPVTKTYRDVSTNTTKSCTDKLFLLSAREVFGANTSYESEGPIYSDYFKKNSTRIKYNASNTATSWWLRTAHSTGNYTIAHMSGILTSSLLTNQSGLVFGFCTGA